MILLPVYLRKNGFNYTQVHRGGRSCVCAQEASYRKFYSELLLIKVKSEHVFNEKHFPAKEWFPPNEAFGKWAWSYQSIEKALIAYNRLEGASPVKGE
jgi:hypothetical protein